MSSTYSALLRLELIGAGEQSGLWGNTTNSNIGTLLEQAIAGVTFVSLTSAVSPYTLSTTNGTPDEQRSAALLFSGTPSGAFTIIVPALQKHCIVRNATTQTLTFKTLSQVGGVDLISGASMILFCDGTNVYPAIAGLSVAQGGTGGTDQASAQTGLNVPSRTGVGASGTWGINITGSCAGAVTGSIAGSSGVSSATVTSARTTILPLTLAGTGSPVLDQTSNRVVNTVYTNNYGKPMYVYVRGYTTANADFGMVLSVNGVYFSTDSNRQIAYEGVHIGVPVPTGGTYQLLYFGAGASSGVINVWNEIS